MKTNFLQKMEVHNEMRARSMQALTVDHGGYWFHAPELSVSSVFNANGMGAFH